eukprot:GFUD01021342.1.p1 GENE.GFUD01021342.1~~GFUD01021342.1.p1  ORF type:complete len:636 (-),score=251.17 GFUD01021342.1:183-2090(-)
MGKSRKSRKVLKSRDDPVGLDAAILELENGMEKEVDNCGDNSIMHKIMAQLQSVNPEDRICGCHSLSSLTSIQGVREEAMQMKVARICGPLLQDRDQLVVQAAAGCLHNLSCEGGEVVEQLVEQDILTPLASLMEQFRGLGSEVVEERKMRTLVDSLGLMWNIMEQSQTATNIFNRQNMIDTVLQFLDTNRFPPSLVLSSLSLLATACDNNTPAQHKMIPHTRMLSDLLQSEVTSHHIKVTTGVVMMNMLGSQLCDSQAFPLLISTVSDCLLLDTRQMVSDWSSSSPLEEEEGEMEVEGLKEATKEDKVGEECKDIIRAQIAALEIITNLASQEECDDSLENDSDASDFDEMAEEDPNSSLHVSTVNPAMAEVVMSHQLAQTILLRANDLPSNVKQILSSSKQGRSLLNLSQQLVIRCFLCLSNLTDSLSLAQLGGCDSLHHTWTGLGRICCQKEDSLMDSQLVEAATSAMRSSTAKLCQDASAYNLFSLGPSDLDQLLAVYSSPQATIRTNIVNILGDLASLAAKHLDDPASCQVLSTLSLWLVDTAAKDVDLRVAAEALDKLFDIFGEDDTDRIFAELKLLQKLNIILPELKSRIGQSKQSLKEDLPIVNMAKANLQRFVKYKGKRPIIAGNI